MTNNMPFHYVRAICSISGFVCYFLILRYSGNGSGRQVSGDGKDREQGYFETGDPKCATGFAVHSFPESMSSSNRNRCPVCSGILRPNLFATDLMVDQRGLTRRLSKDYLWLSSIYQQVLL